MDGSMQMGEGEPGAVDNRLSLVPKQFDVEDWKDGETYNLTLKVRQISPGEFEVLERTDTGEQEPEESVTEANPGDSESIASEGENYPNPAVRRMMRQ